MSCQAATSTPIAIIGIGLRGPGDGSTPEKFWQMLLDARSSRCEVPRERYDIDGYYHPDPERLGSIQPRYESHIEDCGLIPASCLPVLQACTLLEAGLQSF